MKKVLPIALLLLLCSFSGLHAQGTARFVLLEQFTGTWCGWCPYGSDSVAAILARMPNVNALAYHSGDVLETTETAIVDTMLYISSYPGAAVDRMVWNYQGKATFGLGRDAWGAACAIRAPIPSPISIVVDSSTYDPATRLISFIIKLNVLVDMPGEYYYAIVISEDSVNAAQTKYFVGGGSTILDPYFHKRVVRKMPITSFGSRLTSTGLVAGQTIRRTYNYVVPVTVGWNLDKCSITILVDRKYPGIVGEHREVQQSWQKKFFDALIYLPVNLVSFNAERVGDDARLMWRTDGESSNKGWAIERRIDLADWRQIDFVEGRGTTTLGQTYEYVDRSADKKGVYDYRLRQTDYDGTNDVSPVARVLFTSVPTSTHLNQNHPNPFNPTTQLSVDLAEATTMKLQVFDAVGRMVATLADGAYESGSHVFDWNAIDAGGSPLPSGVYFYRLTTPGHVETRQMMLSR